MKTSLYYTKHSTSRPVPITQEKPIVVSMAKICPYCHKRFVRKKGESRKDFEHRVFCGTPHRKAYYNERRK
jgi:hypothetical protein